MDDTGMLRREDSCNVKMRARRGSIANTRAEERAEARASQAAIQREGPGRQTRRRKGRTSGWIVEED